MGDRQAPFPLQRHLPPSFSSGATPLLVGYACVCDGPQPPPWVPAAPQASPLGCLVVPSEVKPAEAGAASLAPAPSGKKAVPCPFPAPLGAWASRAGPRVAQPLQGREGCPSLATDGEVP